MRAAYKAALKTAFDDVNSGRRLGLALLTPAVAHGIRALTLCGKGWSVAGLTVFCVQPFWRRGANLVQGDLRQFRSEALARHAGVVASHHAPGVVVYRLSGEPEFDTWSEPCIIARYGETPEAS